MGTPGDKPNINEVEQKPNLEETLQESLAEFSYDPPVTQTTTGEQGAPTTSGMTVITPLPYLRTFTGGSSDPSTRQQSGSAETTLLYSNLEQASIEQYFGQSKYYPISSENLQPISILPRETKTFLSISEPGPSGLQTIKTKHAKRNPNRTKHHTIRKSHICSICQKTFQNPSNLAKHQLTHNGKSPFKCEHCKKTFSSRFKLVRHILIHSDRKPFSCSVCDRTFHRKDHLKNHIKIHSPSKKHYICEKFPCKKEYTSLLSFKKHMAMHAAEEGSLECQICLKMFENKDDIMYHLKIHAGSRTVKNPNEKKYNCDYCDRKFFTRKDVRRHLVVHTGMRDFLCQFCPQRFGRKDHLVRHIKKSHSRSVELDAQSEIVLKQEILEPMKTEIPDLSFTESVSTLPPIKLESKMDIKELGLFYSDEYDDLTPMLPTTSEQLHFLSRASTSTLLEEIVESSTISSLATTEIITSENVQTTQLLEEPVLSDTEIMRLLEPTDEQNLPLPGFSQTFQTPPPPKQ